MYIDAHIISSCVLEISRSPVIYSTFQSTWCLISFYMHAAISENYIFFFAKSIPAKSLLSLLTLSSFSAKSKAKKLSCSSLFLLSTYKKSRDPIFFQKDAKCFFVAKYLEHTCKPLTTYLKHT